MINILHDGKLKVSFNDGMSNSLTDRSTEAFSESRDEPRGKPRTITLTYERKIKPFGDCIHIDNTKDSGVSSDSQSHNLIPILCTLIPIPLCLHIHAIIIAIIIAVVVVIIIIVVVIIVVVVVIIIVVVVVIIIVVVIINVVVVIFFFILSKSGAVSIVGLTG